MHKAKFNTVAGNFSFARDGEWSETRQVWTQFQNVQPNNLDQFRDGKVQPIVWPIELLCEARMRFHTCREWTGMEGELWPQVECSDRTLGDTHDVAVLVDVVNSMPRKKN
jgi:hypothetical protein